MDLYTYLFLAIFLPLFLAGTVAMSKKQTWLFNIVNIVVL